jgi:ATP-dependent helicase/nuclease subunit A
MMKMGNAVHGFLAAYGPRTSRADHIEMAEGLLARWGVKDALSPEDLLEIGDRLRSWISAHWPEAVWHREWPVDQRLESGTIARGVADLILETKDGLVIVDHKAYVADRSEARDLALKVGEQVQYYADGTGTALGKKIVGMFVHFPMLGEIVGLT